MKIFKDPEGINYDEGVTEQDEKFAAALFDLLQELVNTEDLNEAFANNYTLQNHFYKHCLGANSNKKSSRQNVYYDFKYVNQYKDYEDKIAEKINTEVSSTYNKGYINSLYDSDKVKKAVYNLFKGNSYVYFPPIVGLHNQFGGFALGLHAYATGVTTNYMCNTIDLILITKSGKTLTLYPVDANYLENKLNNLIKNYSNLNTTVKFNK
mgnify:CR=1 FL=1